MSDKVAEEVRILLKRLRTPAFRFVIAYYNHTDAVHYLEHKIRAQFPEQPFLKLDASQTTYAEISQTFRELQHGILWLENFHDVLQLETDSSGKETAAMAKRNQNRSDITAGLNLRRDRWAKSPIALFLLISTPQLRVPLIKTIMEKMPDLWSFRTQVMDLEVRIPVRTDDFGGMPRVESHIPRTTLGGDTLESQQAELNRLQSALSETPDEAVQLRNNLMEQILDLDAHIHHLTFGTPPKLSYIRKLIARDDLSGALAALKQLLADSPKLDEALLQSARFADLRKQIRQGILSPAEASVSRNRIRAGLLELLRDVEARQATKPALREEIEQAVRVVNSKNVVAGGNTSAGRDLHIGDRKEIHHHYGDKKIPRQLTTAGAAVPTGFIGREREMAEIRRQLTTGGGALALVNAEGGMGKTTLAAKYWERFGHEYQHLAWLFCENGILNAMRSLLPEPLGLREAMNEVADKPERQIQLIVNCMTNLPKDCLLVLDNANEPAFIQDFEQHCVGLGWHVLITSRCSKVLTDPKAEYTIRSLPPGKAQELFRSNYDEKTPEFEALLDRFLHALGYNTLCIEVFSKTLREGAAWGLDFEKLLQKLETNGLRLGRETFEIKTNWTQNNRSNAADSDQIIQALYDVSSLTFEEGELLVRFCLLPAESHPPAVLGALLAPDDKPGLKRALDQLVQKGWLSSDTRTYRVSPVVQKILLSQYADSRWDLGKAIVARLNIIFETEGYHSKNIAMAGSFAELALGLVDNLGVVNEDLANLYYSLWVFQNASGNLVKALDMAERMRALCEASGDKYNLGRAYEKLGDTHRTLGDLQKALTFFEQYNQFVKELHEAYPQDVDFKNGLAISYSKLGGTHRALGNLLMALTFSKRFNHLMKQLQEAHPQNTAFKKNLAFSYEKLGEAHSELGNLTKALTFFERFNQLTKELHEAHPQNVSFKTGLAGSYATLGETHHALGNLLIALTFFDRCNQLTKELHQAYPQNVILKNGLAASYAKLAQFHRDHSKDLPQAKAHFQQAEQLWAELARDAPQYAQFQQFLAQVREEMKN